MVVMFEDRADAARKLCQKLKKYKDTKDTIVVGLTRGGVVTAKVISDFLGLKLKALVVKKIGAPGNSEFAIGALVSAKDVYWNEDTVKELKVKNWEKEDLVSQKEKEVRELERQLKIKTTPFEYKDKNAIVVDDGVATGATVIAAAKYLKRNKAREIILATPVISFDILGNIKNYFDVAISLKLVPDFYAVGQFYRSFDQVSNKEVAQILTSSN
jgi:putative phosphoribosyl transferase